MKNYLYSLITVAALLFATACSESEQASDAAQVARVTFTLRLNDGVDTRAIGDGTTAKALLYELRRGNQIVKKETIADAFADGLTYQLTFEVMVGARYEYVFWAQSPDAPYGTEDLSAIRMNYENAPANDEHRDAFYAIGSFWGEDSYGHAMLKRPFAQLNVGGQNCVYETAVLGDMHIDYSTVHLKKVPSVFHPFTGEAADPQDVEFKVTLTPDKQTGDTLWVNVDSIPQAYRYFSMNYLLAHTDKLIFDSWIGLYGTPTIRMMEVSMPNVPLQRNYRTNILFSCGGGDNPDDPDDSDKPDPDDPNPDKPDPDVPDKPVGPTIVFGDVTFNIIISPDFEEDYTGPPFE